VEYVYINDDGMLVDDFPDDITSGNSKTLTVGELIDELRNYQRDAPVFLEYHRTLREIRDWCIGSDEV
jgi:hypothetical protein